MSFWPTPRPGQTTLKLGRVLDPMRMESVSPWEAGLTGMNRSCELFGTKKFWTNLSRFSFLPHCFADLFWSNGTSALSSHSLSTSSFGCASTKLPSLTPGSRPLTAQAIVNAMMMSLGETATFSLSQVSHSLACSQGAFPSWGDMLWPCCEQVDHKCPEHDHVMASVIVTIIHDTMAHVTHNTSQTKCPFQVVTQL